MAKKRYLIDTNILVRYLAKDNPAQCEEISRIFREAKKGKWLPVLRSTVVAETCFVLESRYGMSKQQTADSFKTILSQKWIEVDERRELLATMERCARGQHFVDAYLSACSGSDDKGVFTFDKGLRREISQVIP